MYKIINSEGKIHNYSSLFWGHNLEWDNGTVHSFKDLETQIYSGHTFSNYIIRKGDFIYRKMKSGMFGLYEVVEIKPSGHGVHDMYYGKYIFCGYYYPNVPNVEIFPGYGIYSSKFNSFIIWINKILSGEK